MVANKHILLAASALFCLMMPVASSAASGNAPVILKGSTAEDVVEESIVKDDVTVEEVAADRAPEVATMDESTGSEDYESSTVTDTGLDLAGGHPIAKLKWSFDGIFGTYDRAALQRGFQVYQEACSACHSLERLSYRNLSDLGYSEDEVKAIAAAAVIIDGPDDEGEMYERPGRPSDRFKSPFPNVKAAQAANNGSYPPDLSLLAKARHGGADYIYAIMTGYGDAPSGVDLAPGQYWNNAMSGNIIAMPPPLNVDQVGYSDGTVQSIEQYAKDIAHFMTWAAEPAMEIRKRTGVKVFLFLLIFSGVMYGVKRKIWADLH